MRKHSEKLYELIFNTAGYGISVTDRQHLLLTANAHFCKITGYGIEELEGKSIFMMLPPKTRPKVEAMYKEVAEGIVHPERIIKVISKNGHSLLLSLSIQYVQDGEDHYFINSFKSVDASERYVNLFKETEKAAKIGGWEVDLISRQPLMSDEVSNIYEIPLGEPLTIEDSLQFYLPEYRTVLNRALEDATTHGKPFNAELRLTSARGNAKWVRVTCNPVTIDEHTIKLYGSIQDISREKSQHLRIQESEKKYKTLAENLPNGTIFTVDRDYRFTFMAGTELEKLGVNPAFFEGKSLSVFNAPDQMEIMKENFTEVFEGATRSFEIIYEGKRYLLSAIPLTGEENVIKEIMVVSQNINEKYKAERELERQHDFLMQLINSSSNLILVKDRNGRFILVNKAFADFYHTSPEQLVGKNNAELRQVSKEERERYQAEDQAIFQGKTSKIAIEEKAVGTDGTEYWFKTVKTPVISEDGPIEQVLMVAADITEQKQAALEVARSEAYLKAIFNSGEVGIFAVDRNLNTIFFNEFHAQRHQEIHGWELKRGDLIITNPEMKDEFEPLFRRAFEGECFLVEKIVSNFDGASHWAEFSFSPIKMEGKITGALVMARDITNRKSAEQKVIDNEKRFRAIIENGFDCIILYNEAEEIQYASATIVKTFGYTENEVLGRKVAEFIHPDDLEKRNKDIAGVFQGKVKNILRQERIRHKDGHYLWIEVSITNMLDKPGVEAIVASFREITDRKLAERKQQQALQKEKILNESLTKINAELDQFVYSTSHNLRAPLTSMLGVIHVIKSEGGMSGHAMLIHLIEKSIHQLDATIQEITDYARNNRTEVTAEPIDFEKIISNTIDSLKFMEEANRISIQYEIDDNLEFSSDPRRLRVIFNNLLSNAIKYQNLSLGQPRIDILVKRVEKNVMIKIQDNGIGIRSDQQDKIFNMFHRATDRSMGAGLGLYIVKETLDKLQGTIEVSTEYGKGTTFTLKIPDLFQEKLIDKLSLP